jgi:HPt (histidine-containing phosphotransfer) domain-containing protein
MHMTETFCREDLVRILGDEDYEAAHELRALFEVEAQRLVAELSRAVDCSDELGVARAAHKLKSVAGNVGGRATRGLAIAIEDAARLRDRQQMERLAATLFPEVEALRAALSGFVSALRAGSARH